MGFLFKDPYFTRPPKRPINILLSYPGSGNHFVRFLIEYISKRPTRGCMYYKRDVYICRKTFQNPELLRHVDPEGDPMVYKSHKLADLHKYFGGKCDSLILIIRDYRECLQRFHSQLTVEHLDEYCQLIKYYHQFTTGPKMLIYYEDLISAPDRVIKIAQQLYDFLGMSDRRYLEYFKQGPETTESIIQQSRQCSDSNTAYKYSSNGQVVYWGHGKNNSEQISELEQYLYQTYPELVPYVARYLTHDDADS